MTQLVVDSFWAQSCTVKRHKCKYHDDCCCSGKLPPPFPKSTLQSSNWTIFFSLSLRLASLAMANDYVIFSAWHWGSGSEHADLTSMLHSLWSCFCFSVLCFLAPVSSEYCRSNVVVGSENMKWSPFAYGCFKTNLNDRENEEIKWISECKEGMLMCVTGRATSIHKSQNTWLHED